MAGNDTGDAGASPDGWVSTEIRNVFEIHYGKGLTKANRDQGGQVPVYGSSGIVGYHTEALVDNPCIVIGRKGAVGKAHLSRVPCWPIDTTYFIHPPEGFSPEYVYYALDFLDLGSLDKSTTIPGLNRDDFYAQMIPIPSSPEQHRIVAEIERQFTRLEAGIAALKRAQARLRRYKAAVLKAACEGHLLPDDEVRAIRESPDYEPADALLARVLTERCARWRAEHPGKRYKEPAPPDTEDLSELPEGWVWVTVEQIGEVRLGRQRSPKHHQGPFMRPYLRAANATWDGVDLSDVKEMNFSPKVFETYRLQKGDILLSEASGSPEEVGKPFVWNEEIPNCCFQNTLIRVRLFNLPSSFVYVHFLKDARTGRFATIARGVGIHHLGASRLSVFPIAMPPLAEQRRIVAEVERRLTTVAELEKQVEVALRRAERLRQAVLKRAFEGRLVPQDPNDEPASALLARIQAARAKRSGEVTSPKPRQMQLPMT